MPPPDTRRGQAPNRPALPNNVELSSTDFADGTSVASIIESIRMQLPPRTASRWNEQARNRQELAAWIGGRKRVCDLPERV